jgi:arylsulfatase A-like enzyme
MRTIGKLLCWFACAAAGGAFAETAAWETRPEEKAERPPNIVLFFSDDAGYHDFGFQGGSDIRTPQLDKLAARAIRCTSAYTTASVCGPSRAGLLTGRYQQRFGFHENNVPSAMSRNSGLRREHMGVPLDEKLLPEYLKPLGYRSMVLGKWHLGGADRFHPLKRGFDEFYGFRGGQRSYWPSKDPGFLNRMERDFGKFEEHEGYLTDVLADEACAFIGRNKDRPFFVYLSFNAPHTPMHAKPEDLAQFPELSGRRKTLAAMTLAMDRACGRVLDQLDELGLSENTIVVFTNDNGGPTPANASSNYPLSGVKGIHREGGIRVPFLFSWPERLKGGATYDRPIMMFDLLPTFHAAAGGDPAESQSLDGVNLLPFLTGRKEGRPHSTLFWKWDLFAAVRDGDWKLIRLPDRPAELFNLANDIGETRNLASENPEVVRSLYEKLFAWELEVERPLWLLQPWCHRAVSGWYDEYGQAEPPRSSHEETQADQ